MQASTLSETGQYIEDFVHFAIENIHTEKELRRFLSAADLKIAESSDRLRELLIEIEMRVLASVEIQP